MSSAAVVIGTLRVKVYSYTSMFFHLFTKGNNFCDLLFASSDNVTVSLSKMKIALKGKTLLLEELFHSFED